MTASLRNRFGLPLKTIELSRKCTLSNYKAGGTSFDDLRIEVKATPYSLIHCVLTCLEWDVTSRHPDQHLFHIWNLETEECSTYLSPIWQPAYRQMPVQGNDTKSDRRSTEEHNQFPMLSILFSEIPSHQTSIVPEVQVHSVLVRVPLTQAPASPICPIFWKFPPSVVVQPRRHSLCRHGVMCYW